MSELLQVAMSVGCVIIGWMLNEASAKLREKPKLCFRLTGTPEAELTEKSLRTKTSPSEYGVEIYNLGHNPVILEQFSLNAKKTRMVDCFIADEERTILPYKSIIYTLDEQEANALLRHCKRLRIENCKVAAVDVSGKRIAGKMDLGIIGLRVKLLDRDDAFVR